MKKLLTIFCATVKET